MNQAEQLLKNLVLNYSFSIPSVEDGLKKLKSKQRDLEAVHIYLDHLTDKAWDAGNRKKYFNISKIERLTKLDEWIFDNLIQQDEYRRYLNKCLPLKNKLRFADVDEYILNRHYRPKAIKVLKNTRKNFDLIKWTKKRFKYEYQRKTNLYLKDGTPLRFDFRNWLESLFILKQSDKRVIIGVGGSGGSGQRENYTKFTAIFYLLGKKQRIKHHLLKYNSVNKFEYINTFDKPIITFDLGSNYPLDEKLRKEIQENGIELFSVIGCNKETI